LQEPGVTGNNQARFRRGYRRKISVPVPAEQLAEATIESADDRIRSVAVLDGVDIGFAIAIEITRDDAFDWRDLSQAGQRLEVICTVGLTQEDSTA